MKALTNRYMNGRMKLWVGVGAFVITQASTQAIADPTPESASTGDRPIATQPHPVAPAPLSVAQAGGEGGEGGEGIAPQSVGFCAAIAVEGGGEGGESGAAQPVSSPVRVYGAATVPALPFGDRQVLTSFVDTVLLPTYGELNRAAQRLHRAIAQFAARPTQANLQATRQAWLAARLPWESSEAFAFGPAASLGYDAGLDDWPVNEVDVLAILQSQDALTPEYLETLQTSQKGFHTIEFLLFGRNNDKRLTDFTPRELEYLQLIGADFAATAENLLASWAEGVEGYPAYRKEFVEAGDRSTAYPTPQAAATELVQGIIDILDELGAVKIGEALDAQNPFLLESRFSHSSLQDFYQNLRSVELTYFAGSASRPGRHSLSRYVASIDPSLDTQVRQYLLAAESAVKAIPGPIETTLCDPAAKPQIAAARDSLLTLRGVFEQWIMPLVQE